MKTTINLTKLSLSELAKVFNFASETEVKRFSNKAAGMRRANEAIQEFLKSSDIEEFVERYESGGNNLPAIFEFENEPDEKKPAEKKAKKAKKKAPVKKPTEKKAPAEKKVVVKAADRPVDLAAYEAVKSDPYRVELGETNDCVVIAITLLTGKPYEVVHKALKAQGRKDKKGTGHAVWSEAVADLGFKAEEYDLPSQVSSYPGCHGILLSNVTSFHPKRFPEYFPSSMPDLLCITARHGFAMMGGETKDWSHEKYLRIKSTYKITKV